MTNKEAIEYLIDPIGKGLAAHEEAIKIAVDAIEKQIPKKPVNYDSVPHSRCPVCNNSVKVFEDAHEHHYCLYCGQVLDWRA